MLFVFPIAVFAAELPPLPEKAPRTEPGAHDCREIYPLESGSALVCDSIAVPPYQWASLANELAWCSAVVERYDDDTRLLLGQQERCAWKLELARRDLETALLPTPVMQRHSTWLAIGVVSGGALTIGALTIAISASP